MGRGTGECVVVHLPGGDWMVIDSFNTDGGPAGLWYLNHIGVPATDVWYVVNTHLDRDHYLGLEALVAACTSSRLCFSAGMSVDWAERFFAAEVIVDDRAPSRAIAIARQRHLDGRGQDVALLKAGLALPTSIDDHDLRVIAPLEVVARQVVQELLELGRAGGDRSSINGLLTRHNRTSVVVHVDVGLSPALLTGDLEKGPAGFGWADVVADRFNAGLSPATMMKVPHHGSTNAEADELWDLVKDPAVLVIAPNTNAQLPDPGVVDRLLAHGRVYQAGGPVELPEMDVDEFGNETSEVGPLGAVVCRIGPGDHAWSVGRVGAGVIL